MRRALPEMTRVNIVSQRGGGGGTLLKTARDGREKTEIAAVERAPRAIRLIGTSRRGNEREVDCGVTSFIYRI